MANACAALPTIESKREYIKIRLIRIDDLNRTRTRALGVELEDGEY